MSRTHEMVKNSGEKRWECRFCQRIWRELGDYDQERTDKLEDCASEICHAAERRELIFDVGLESSEVRYPLFRKSTHETRELDLAHQMLTPWAESLVRDGIFASKLAAMTIGAGHDGHGELVAEFFREIRAERRRLELGEDMIRIDHPVYVDTTDINKDKGT